MYDSKKIDEISTEIVDNCFIKLPLIYSIFHSPNQYLSHILSEDNEIKSIIKQSN